MRFYRWTIAAILLAPVVVKAGVALTVNAPGVETSQVLGVTTETFDSFTTGNHTSLVTAVGTLTGTSPGFDIHVPDQFGAAGGVGNYVVIGTQSGQTSAVLTLTSPASYFGMWLSALDTQNSVSLYLGGIGGTLVGTYSASTISAAIGGNSAYLGNPSGPFAGQDTTEKFAYLNFTGTGGTTFDTVAFNNNGTGTGQEMDNFSVLASSPVPLPSGAGVGLLGLALAGGVLTMRRGKLC